MENSHFVESVVVLSGSPPGGVIVWCEENVGQYGVDWAIRSDHIYMFKDEECALMFKLKWLGHNRRYGE